MILFELWCIIRVLFVRKGKIMEGYLTLKEMSAKWEISARRINTLCNEGRIKGATRIGNMWIISSEAEKPKNERVKSGRYVKETSYGK